MARQVSTIILFALLNRECPIPAETITYPVLPRGRVFERDEPRRVNSNIRQNAWPSSLQRCRRSAVPKPIRYSGNLKSRVGARNLRNSKLDGSGDGGILPYESKYRSDLFSIGVPFSLRSRLPSCVFKVIGSRDCLPSWKITEPVNPK